MFGCMFRTVQTAHQLEAATRLARTTSVRPGTVAGVRRGASRVHKHGTDFA